MNYMSYEEAREYQARTGMPVWEAQYDGEVWDAGRMVEVGDALGYYATEAEAKEACADYERFDFTGPHKHLRTFVERRDDLDD